MTQKRAEARRSGGAGAEGSAGGRNLAVVSLTSFLTDVSSEMVLRLLPLYLAGTLGLRVSVIGLIEGVAESTASLLALVSGRLSDRLDSRKRLAVAGYGLSALARPFFLVAGSWAGFAAVRWVDRVGKGLRTAPRDALLALSVRRERRGFAFGLHRAADTAGAAVGLGVALLVVWHLQRRELGLGVEAFRSVVLLSLVPALAAVAVLAWGAREVAVAERPAAGGSLSPRGLGRPFLGFLAIVALFDLGNSSDAFLVLRAAERGLSVVGVLGMLLASSAVYALASAPAGWLSDRLGRRPLLLSGWLLYALVYLGLALARDGAEVWVLVVLYGAYHGLTHGTAKAMVADLVPAERRGTAFGFLAMVLGLIDLPASVIAGILWHGLGSWPGWGPAAPFFFGAVTALAAAALLALWDGGRSAP